MDMLRNVDKQQRRAIMVAFVGNEKEYQETISTVKDRQLLKHLRAIREISPATGLPKEKTNFT